MKNLFVNVKPNPENQLTVDELATRYAGCVFENKDLIHTNRFDKESAMDVIVLAHADRLMTDLKKHDAYVTMCLTKSNHPQYPGYLLFLRSVKSVGNINPIIAKFFIWDKIEYQDRMDLSDFSQL